MPDGIDPDWATNPGLSRARTLMHSLEAKLEEAGPAVPKRAIAEIWHSDVPHVRTAVATERLQLPVAYSPRVQAAIGSKGPLVSVSNETVRRKTGKADPGSRADFRLGQALADHGALVSKGEQGLWAVGSIDGRIWRVALKRAVSGFAYVATLGPIRVGQLRGVAVPDRAGAEWAGPGDVGSPRGHNARHPDFGGRPVYMM